MGCVFSCLDNKFAQKDETGFVIGQSRAKQVHIRRDIHGGSMAITSESEIPGIPDATGSAPNAGWSVMIAASLASGAAHLGTSTMPFQVGALMDAAGYSASLAGLYGFFVVASLALVMLAISPIIHRIRPELLAVAGGVLGAIAHAGIYLLSPGTGLLFALAVVAGIAYGLIFAGMVAASAVYRNAERLYGVANAGALVFLVAVMQAFPYATRLFGPYGPFLFIAMMLLIPCPAFLLLKVAGKSASAPHLAANPKPEGVAPGAYALLATWAAFSLGTGALWSFAERIGHALKLDAETVSLVLSASTFCGIAGTGIAAAFAGKIPRVGALVFGMITSGLSCAMVGLADNLVVYGLGVLAYWVFYMFLYSSMLGVAAVMDPSGRVGTAGGGFERLAFAIGAPLGGLVVDYLSYAWLGVLACASCLLILPFTVGRIRSGLVRLGAA